MWLILLSAAALNSPAFADAAAAGATSTQEAPAWHRDHYSAQISYLTSRAGGHDFRSFRSSGTGDDGNVSENSSMPNMNYLSVRGGWRFAEKQQLLFGGLQSLDPASARNVTTASGRNRRLSGQIFSLRYVYSPVRNFSLAFADTHTDTSGFLDPTVNLTYRESVDQGWAKRVGLGFSAPMTERSRNETLLTRATIRTGLTFNGDNFTSGGSLSYSRPFYRNAPPDTRGGPRGSEDAPRAGGNGRAGTRRAGDGGSVGGANVINADPSLLSLEEVDLLLMQREVSRATAAYNFTYAPGTKWRLSTAIGTSRVQTARKRILWLTSYKPIGAAYNVWKNLELGSDLQLFSDIHNYHAPSLPRLWSLALRVTYSFGTERRNL